MQPIDSHDVDAAASQSASGADPMHSRPWLAVYWRCCHVYNRVYRTRDGAAYSGACPSCGKRVRARIGPDGLNGRFFTTK